MQKHTKQTAYTIIFLLLTSIILCGFTIQQAKAQTSYVITFFVSPSASGTIQWIDLTEPYHNGQTTSSYSMRFLSGDELQITTIPNNGNTFNSYYFVSTTQSGYLNPNPFTTTPILEDFNITAEINIPQNPYVTVIANNSTITWTNLTEPYHDGSITGTGSSQGTAIPMFQNGDLIQFQDTPNTGYQFDYYYIYGWTGGGYTDTDINPINITMDGNFTIQGNTLPNPVNKYFLTITTTTGGLIVWTDNTTPYHNGAVGLGGTQTQTTQTVLFPYLDSLTFQYESITGYQFNCSIIGATNNTSPIYTMTVDNNYTMTAYFEISTSPTPTPTIPPLALTPTENIIITIIIFLAVIFSLGFLGAKLMGEFGALLGINIGWLLCFIIPLLYGIAFLPVWSIMVLVIVDAIYFFGQRRDSG